MKRGLEGGYTTLIRRGGSHSLITLAPGREKETPHPPPRVRGDSRDRCRAKGLYTTRNKLVHDRQGTALKERNRESVLREYQEGVTIQRSSNREEPPKGNAATSSLERLGRIGHVASREAREGEGPGRYWR